MLKRKEKPIIMGPDDFAPDYSKTWEEDWEVYRKRYRELHGEDPIRPEPAQPEPAPRGQRATGGDALAKYV